ncbi:MAG TPA: zinc ribbon domain-containing protein [Bacilli bacterium]|nr:zinc ribbon domain-containing protein [Bacilli bacterium]HPS19125.1 zinc ribbon domain-containing protein [Bacilli bacterium]
MYCPKCGKIIDDNSSFCPSCGVDVNHGEALPKKKDANKSVFASVAVVFTTISVLCLLISFLLGYLVKEPSASAFNIFATTFIIAALPFYIISLVKNVFAKRSVLNPLLSLVFIAVAFIFCLITSVSLATVINSTVNEPHSFYLSVVSMAFALEVAAIIFGTLSIKQQ